MDDGAGTIRCPECGAAVGAAGSLCPACLLRMIASDSIGDAAVTHMPGAAAAGTRLRYVGDYELLEEIARGGMGIVFKARQVSLNRVVAVKMILAGELASDDAVRRFRTEAEAAAALQHPHIVAIHEIGEHEGQHYFSMDYVEGTSLDRLTGRPFPTDRAARYVKAIAEAVQYAHERGVLHRDLKPHNILIDRRDEPRVTDFGLAKRLADGSPATTRTDAVMGTPSYMAPEQASARPDRIGPATDVYALGAILYELMSGRPPFAAESPLDTMRQVVEALPTPPRTLNPFTSRDLEIVCLKCLEKEPGHRYESAAALVDDLGRILNREPIRAVPAPLWRTAAAWTRRHPWVYGACASMVILLLLAVVWGLWDETRYLAWIAGHPGYARTFGARSARAAVGGTFLIVWSSLASLCAVVTSRRQPASHPTTPRASPRWSDMWVFVNVAAIAVGVGYALYAMLAIIDAYVWEGLALTPRTLFPAWYSVFTSYLLARSVIRERRAARGRGREDLRPEEIARIEAALFAGSRIRALAIYCKATGSDPSVANGVLDDMAARLYADDPHRFGEAPAPTPTPQISGIRLVGGLFAIIAGASVLASRAAPDDRALDLVSVLACLLCGTGFLVAWSTRTISTWWFAGWLAGSFAVAAAAQRAAAAVAPPHLLVLLAGAASVGTLPIALAAGRTGSPRPSRGLAAFGRLTAIVLAGLSFGLGWFALGLIGGLALVMVALRVKGMVLDER